MNETYRDAGAFVLLIAVLASIVFLAHEKIIDGPATVGIITTIVTLAGGALAVHSGVKAGSKAANGREKK
jgi:hypothetical protein